MRRCSGGLLRSRPSWPARGPGCCWPRRCWLSPRGRVEGVDAPLDAAERAFTSVADEPFESTVGQESWLLNVPATVTTQRAYLAALRGDAEGAASFASRALAEIGETSGWWRA